jgi:uncharacterized protein involved in high-affinity Fe2+ transport
VDALEASLTTLKEGPDYENNEKVGVAIGHYKVYKASSKPRKAFLKNSKKCLKHFKA